MEEKFLEFGDLMLHMLGEETLISFPLDVKWPPQANYHCKKVHIVIQNFVWILTLSWALTKLVPLKSLIARRVSILDWFLQSETKKK